MSAFVVKDTRETLTHRRAVMSMSVSNTKNRHAVLMPFAKIFLEAMNALVLLASMEILSITVRNATVLNAVVNHLTN